MDLNKMTKEELIQLVQEQSHLASAVEAKDKEIVELKTKNTRLLSEKDKQIAEINHKHAELINKVNELESKHLSNEKLISTAEKLDAENRKVVAHLNLYIDAFRNTLKAQQGVLDNAIQLEAFISESLRRK